MLAIPEDVIIGTTSSYTVPAGKYAVVYPYAEVRVTSSTAGNSTEVTTSGNGLTKIQALEGQVLNFDSNQYSNSYYSTNASTAATQPINYFTMGSPSVFTIDGVDVGMIAYTEIQLTTLSSTVGGGADGWSELKYIYTTIDPYWTIAIYPIPVNNLPDELKE